MLMLMVRERMMMLMVRERDERQPHTQQASLVIIRFSS